MRKNKLRLCMLISGGGTTASEIIRACLHGMLADEVEPVLVIASKPDAGGIERTKAAGMKDEDVIVIRRNALQPPEYFGEEIVRACRERGVEVIGQYGWLPKTPVNVINAFPGCMINQHPGPLDPGYPDFGGKGMFGMRVHVAVLYFARVTGRLKATEATAQRVDPEFDRGAVLHSRSIPIDLENDTPESLQHKVLPIEHQVQIEALHNFANCYTADSQRIAERLIHPDNVHHLADAKRIARILYPHG